LNPFPLTKASNADLKTFHQASFQSTDDLQKRVESESEPPFKPIVQVAEKVAETAAPIRNVEEPSSTPDFDDNRTAQVPATIVGVWAPDASPCTARNFREGFLPTIINTDGAWAGETFCIFRNQKKTETGWGVIANCSNNRERWTAQVRLSVKGDRLIWASKRGVQVYTRCTRDFLMAEAP
jgi:hypothetical protein